MYILCCCTCTGKTSKHVLTVWRYLLNQPSTSVHHIYNTIQYCTGILLTSDFYALHIRLSLLIIWTCKPLLIASAPANCLVSASNLQYECTSALLSIRSRFTWVFCISPVDCLASVYLCCLYQVSWFSVRCYQPSWLSVLWLPVLFALAQLTAWTLYTCVVCISPADCLDSVYLCCLHQPSWLSGLCWNCSECQAVPGQIAWVQWRSV